MVLNLMNMPNEFLFNLKCLLFFVAIVGAVVMLHRDHARPVFAEDKPKATKSSKASKKKK